MSLATSLGCNLRGISLIKYPPVFAKTPPPFAENVTAVPQGEYMRSP